MTDWRTGADCRTVDPELFFPISRRAIEAAPARTICAGCPVQAECLRDAAEKGEQFGIRAGFNLEDRKERALAWAAGSTRPAAPSPKPTTDAGAGPGGRTGRPVLADDERTEIKHGTAAGYAAHLRRKETACGHCTRAHSADRRTRAAKRPKTLQIHGNTVRVRDAIAQYSTTDARLLAAHLHLESHKVTRCLRILRDKGLLEDLAVSA